MKEPVVVGEHWVMYQEVTPYGDLFFHTDIYKWNKSIRKEYVEAFRRWAKKQEVPIFAMPFVDDNKMRKFGRLLGFKVLHPAYPCVDGVERRLWIWSK